jgi:GNAT superfamily N-acetyltransferase
MQTIPDGYSIRAARAADIEIIAHHRAMMFKDMGAISSQDSEALVSATIPWLQNLFAKQQYVGWLVHRNEDVAAGGGVQLRETGPVPDCYRVGRWGHIANIYTAPAHRRRGLARLIMEQILQWSQANNLDQLTLSPSSEGRPLYKSLGFTTSADMRRSAAEKERQQPPLYRSLLQISVFTAVMVQ